MRVKLPNRRPSETRRITYTFEGGKEARILITIGFNDNGAPKEAFCADFKCGTTLHSEVMDACVLVSRLLQNGDDARNLAGAMCTTRDGSGEPVEPNRPVAPEGASLAELVQ